MRPPLLSTSQHLKHRVLRAGLWTGLLNGLTRGAGFIRNVLLARVLSPDDFGVFGIALAVLSIVERFSSTGLQSALVQTKRDIGEYLDTTWTVHVLRGALLCAALVLSAQPLAVLLGETRAAPLIAMVGIAVFLRGLENPGMLMYRRELQARYVFLHRAGPLLLELAVSIGLAIALRSAWALALGLVAGKLAQVVMSYTLHPYRPSVRLHWHQVRELSLYGRWVFLDNLLFLLAYRGDKLIVGKVFGAPSLGLYMLAFSISEVVTIEISRFSQEIAFPAYARMQHDAARVRRAFTLSLDLVASVAFPLAAVLALMAGPLTHVVLGPRWGDVAAILPALALAGATRAVTGSGTVAFAALGHPSLVFRTNLVALLATYLVLIPFVRAWSLPGVAMANAFGAVVSLAPFALYARRTIDITAQEIGQHLLPGAALVVLVGVATAGLAELMSEYSVLNLVGVIGIVFLVYSTGAAALWLVARRGPVGAVMLLRTTRATRHA